MLLRVTLTTVCLLLGGPALGASQKDHDDCNSAFYWRARLHYTFRNFDRAVADMTEAARLDPDDQDIADNLKDLKRGLRDAKARGKRSK